MSAPITHFHPSSASQKISIGTMFSKTECPSCFKNFGTALGMRLVTHYGTSGTCHEHGMCYGCTDEFLAKQQTLNKVFDGMLHLWAEDYLVSCPECRDSFSKDKWVVVTLENQQCTHLSTLKRTHQAQISKIQETLSLMNQF